jgi:hypothetical protein
MNSDATAHINVSQKYNPFGSFFHSRIEIQAHETHWTVDQKILPRTNPLNQRPLAMQTPLEQIFQKIDIPSGAKAQLDLFHLAARLKPFSFKIEP